MTPAEMLMHTTVRLECSLEGNRHSTGTGFFFSFKVDEKTHVPLIVTNKHVIDKSRVGAFVLTKSDDQGQPILGQTERVVFDNFDLTSGGAPEQVARLERIFMRIHDAARISLL